MLRVHRNDFIGLLTTISLVLLIASFTLRENWWGDLLLQIGSGGVLLVPFLLITKWLEGKFTEARIDAQRDAAETRSDVRALVADMRAEQHAISEKMARNSSEIDAIIASRMAEAHKPDREAYEAVARAPSQADVSTALQLAAQKQIIASFGVRVELGGSTGLYLWFQPSMPPKNTDSLLKIVVQTWDLQTVIEAPWAPEVGTIDYFLELASLLKETHYWTGDSGYRPATSLEELSKLLLRGQLASVSATPETHRQMFEVIDDWIVGENYLTNVSNLQPYQILYSKLNDMNWQDHMNEKTWVNPRTFQESLDVAICLIADGLAEGALPDYLPGVWAHRKHKGGPLSS